MPFVTEEIWQHLPIERVAPSIMVAPFPRPDDRWLDPEAEALAGQLIAAIRGVRNLRADLGIAPSARITVRLPSIVPAQTRVLLEQYLGLLARVGTVEVLAPLEHPVGEPSVVVDGIGEIFVPVRGLVDTAEVRDRLERELLKVRKDLEQVEGKLARADFVARAPQEIVAKEKEKAGALRERAENLQRHLQALA
jgi:valyl-tRNA synthetase